MESKEKGHLSFIEKLVDYFYDCKKIDKEYMDGVSYIYLSFIGIFLMFTYSVAHIAHYKLYFVGIVHFCTGLFLLGLLFLSRKNRNFRLFFAIGLSSLNLPIYVASFYIGGGQSAIMFWGPILVLFAMMFGNKIAVQMTCLTGLIGISLIAYLDLNGIFAEIGILNRKELVIYGIGQVIIITLVILVVSIIHRKILNVSFSELEVKTDQINHFIRILCHDIANPLTVIVGRTNIALKRTLSVEDQKKYFTIIQRASVLVTEILDEVRAFEAVNDGKVHVNLEKVRLQYLIDDINFIFEDKLEEKELTLKITGESIEECIVYCDKETFKNHVINNLISNAIKFSLKGGTIELNIVTEKKKVYFRIKDQGIGTPRKMIDKIFDIGEKTSRIGTEGERGTGFGLPLVKTYVELYNGEISVESKDIELGLKEHGTCFKISLKNAA